MNPINDNVSDFVLYTSNLGEVTINVYLEDKTIWLAQKAMSELFRKSKGTIREHLKNIFKEGELEEDLVVRKYETVQKQGRREVNRIIEYYSLEAIIAVAYRTNSKQATTFRIWATKALKEVVMKGFVFDDTQLKQSNEFFGKESFDQLLEKIIQM